MEIDDHRSETPDYLLLEPKHLGSLLESRIGTGLGIAIQAREVSELVLEQTYRNSKSQPEPFSYF